MPIEFRCNRCQRLLRTADATAGKQTKCPECGNIVRIPGASATATPAAPVSAPTAAPLRQPAAPPAASSAHGAARPAAGVAGSPPIRPMPSAQGNPFGTASGTPSAWQPSPNPYLSPSAHGLPGAAMHEVGRTDLEVGDVLDRAWKIYVDNLGPLILGVFVYTLVFALAAIGLMLVMSIGMGIGGALAEAGNDEVGAVVIALSAVAMAVAVMVAAAWFTAGLFRWLLAIARGESASIGILFSGGPHLVAVLGAGLIVTLATTLGYLALLLPGIYLALIFSQFMWLIVDRKASALESLSQSKAVTQGNLLSLFLLGLVAMGIHLVASCIPFGGLFTLPFIYLMMAVAYLRMTGQTTADMLFRAPPGGYAPAR